MDSTDEKPLKEAGLFDIRELFALLWAGRLKILIGTAAFTVIGVVLALFLPKTYEAVATVFPVASSQSSALSDYAGLASMVGVALPTSSGGSDPSKTIAALLSSRMLAERVVQKLNLVDQLGIPNDRPDGVRFQLAVKAMQMSMVYETDAATGVISVTVRLGRPELAETVANTILETLDALLVDKSLTTNSKKRELLLKQAEEQKRKVDSLQAQMAQFQKDTSLLDPKAQSNQALAAYSSLIQQKIELEMSLSTATTSYAPDNPKVSILRNQLANMEKQIALMKTQVDGDLPSLSSAPDNLVRYQNLARDLEIATRIYSALLGSVEQAKLDNDKDQIYVEILDPALRPLYGSPSALLVLILSVGIGFLGVVGFVVLKDAVQKAFPAMVKSRKEQE